MLSCEFCEISKNTFCYRTPPVAASEFFPLEMGIRICRIQMLTLSWQKSLSYRNQSTFANQWAGFNMIGTTLKKELKKTWAWAIYLKKKPFFLLHQSACTRQVKNSEKHWRPCQISKMELFLYKLLTAKSRNSLKKSSIRDGFFNR